MNGRFVLTSRVSPPQSRKVMVRSGGLVFSAAFRRSGWALISGSAETSIPNPPEEWWLDDALANEMGLDIDAIETERRPQKQNLFLVATAQSTNGFIKARNKVFHRFSQRLPK